MLAGVQNPAGARGPGNPLLHSSIPCAWPHRWDDSDEWFKKYDHKLWASLESQAAEAGHGGMDYIMMYDLIDAIRNKKPAPMDCYDAAAWSAISGLSEMSIARGGALVEIGRAHV